jgi:hypothetical protein
MRRSLIFWSASARCTLPVLAFALAAGPAAAPGSIAQSPSSGGQAQTVGPQAQTAATPPPTQIQDQTDIWNVKPDISGKRNGVFPEPEAIDFADHAGYVSLFDGRTRDGWDGRPGVWSVEDGAIVGVSTKDKVAGNTFLVYHGITAKDFDLKLEIKVEWGGGSGVQYRSSTGIPPGRTAGKSEPPLDPRWVMIGPQADFWYPVSENAKQYSGQLYSQNTSLGIVPGAGRSWNPSSASLRAWWARLETARSWGPM